MTDKCLYYRGEVMILKPSLPPNLITPTYSILSTVQETCCTTCGLTETIAWSLDYCRVYSNNTSHIHIYVLAMLILLMSECGERRTRPQAESMRLTRADCAGGTP